MKKLKNFESFTEGKPLFPYGGDLGGDHKKYVSDKDIESGKAKKKLYEPQSKNINYKAYDIEREKNDERKISIFGDTLKGHGKYEQIQYFIQQVERYIDYKDGESSYYLKSISDMSQHLPEGVIEHFDIDITSEEGIKDFIENKFIAFKTAFEMWKEVNNKYPGERYGR